MALKKTVARKPAKTNKTVSLPVEVKNSASKKSFTTSFKSFGLSTKKAVIALLVIVVIVLLVVFRNQFVVATVNGQPISRFALIHELEKQSGKTTLDVLITKALINQEASKKNVSVSEKDLNDEVKRIEDSLKAQGQELEVLLKNQGMSRNDLMEQVKIQVLVKKLLVDKIKVTDKEINDYYEKNKESLPKDMDEKKLKTEIKTQIEQQKLSQESNTFVTDLRSKAKINYYLELK
ncbi:MAG TPA: SurA N-terminal domain-containing protein [Patescibacteria group bacterium]|nr:SurA N-terminal domain-containing protein [Patescibacteria group bacterium]